MKAPIRSLLSATIAITAAAIAVPGLASAEPQTDTTPQPESLSDAITNGKLKLNFRLRYEDLDNTASDVDALTLRSRLTYQSNAYHGFSGLIEMDDVTAIGDGNYPGIADPEGTEVNQAWLSYQFGENNAKYGRQRINLDNQRFVGGVGFRQNEQTYDAFSFTSKSLAETTLFVSNINNVNRIFGEGSPIGDHKNDSWLVNIQTDALSLGKLSVYAYLLDNKDVASFSTDTYGIRFAGKQGTKDATQFSYAVEYAKQSDAANNTASYSTDYLLLQGGVKTKPLGITVGYEVLGADDNGKFITPLATLHKFQGWTDTFLAGGTGNIDTGIEDLYLALDTTVSGFKFKVVYHDFNADNASANVDKLGSELGLLVARKVNDNLGLSVKYADYSADDFGVDTQKLWFTANINF